jgi:hypothetical protein
MADITAIPQNASFDFSKQISKEKDTLKTTINSKSRGLQMFFVILIGYIVFWILSSFDSHIAEHLSLM